MENELNILVVDDDPYLLDLMIETLNTIGYAATGASGGKQALGLLAKRPFHLVITDIKMPEMNGLEFAEAVKREYPEIPVIFISGAFTPTILQKIEGQSFLAKPFRINQIEHLIEEVIARMPQDALADSPDRILVVDDDDSFRLMLMESLKLSGYAVTGAVDGNRAIETLQQGGVGAVITDVKMPGMDGITLARYIRKQWPALPVILITAYLNFDDESQLPARIADGYLMKPFKIESITSLLESLRLENTTRS